MLDCTRVVWACSTGAHCFIGATTNSRRKTFLDRTQVRYKAKPGARKSKASEWRQRPRCRSCIQWFYCGSHLTESVRDHVANCNGVSSRHATCNQIGQVTEIYEKFNKQRKRLAQAGRTRDNRKKPGRRKLETGWPNSQKTDLHKVTEANSSRDPDSGTKVPTDFTDLSSSENY